MQELEQQVMDAMDDVVSDFPEADAQTVAQETADRLGLAFEASQFARMVEAAQVFWACP